MWSSGLHDGGSRSQIFIRINWASASLVNLQQALYFHGDAEGRVWVLNLPPWKQDCGESASPGVCQDRRPTDSRALIFSPPACWGSAGLSGLCGSWDRFWQTQSSPAGTHHRSMQTSAALHKEVTLPLSCWGGGVSGCHSRLPLRHHRVSPEQRWLPSIIPLLLTTLVPDQLEPPWQVTSPSQDTHQSLTGEVCVGGGGRHQSTRGKPTQPGREHADKVNPGSSRRRCQIM